MNTELKTKILAAARGTQTGALIACALGEERDALPRFVSTGIITSDGFLMCNFIDGNGTFRPGAFVGSYADLIGNLDLLATHCALTTPEKLELLAVIKGWISQDYRPVRMVR